MARRKHLIRNRKVEVAAGLGAFLVGALLLHDAYDKRGVPQPVIMRPFTFW
jgi:hypothetical protein